MKKAHFTFPIWSCPFSEVIFVAVADNVEINKRSTVPCKPILKKQGWKLLMMANKKTRMTSSYDGKSSDDVTYLFLSRKASEGCSLVKVILYWRPSHLATWTQRQVAKWSSCKGRLSRRKRNFDRSELPGSGTQICTPRCWELLVTIDT